MRESTRRRVLGAAGAGFAGLLAGCSLGGESDTPTPTATPPPTATPTPTATPVVPAEPPRYWDWLPTPAALEVERYRIGSLRLEPMRAAGAARNLLAPRRYVLEALNSVLAETRELLTVSNDAFGAGLLRGDYDQAAIRDDLTAGDFETAETANRLLADELAVELGSERVRWADHSSPAGVLETFQRRTSGPASESYPKTAEPLRTVLGVVEPAEARFAHHYLPSDRTGVLDGALYHANGMRFDGDAATWHLAIAYADAPPDEAPAQYEKVFAEKQGFTVERTRVQGGLLSLRVSTSTLLASGTEPL